MIKIIHCADLHLDSPFSASTVQMAKTKRELLRGTFTSLILYAEMEKADIMLLPGDLFDSEYVCRSTISLLTSQFERVPNCRFVISPGNHDPYKPHSPYANVKFPSNVYIFTSPTLSKFSFDDINTDVYGFAFTAEAMETNPIAGKHPEDEGKINILSIHADIVGGGKYCPITLKDIGDSGFDYVALGHIHTSDGVHQCGKTYYAYSGCPEGRGWDECGKKSVITLKCEKGAGVFRPSFSTKQLTQRRYERIEIDVTALETHAQLVQAVAQRIADERFDSDTSVRATLTGEVDSELSISAELIEQHITGVNTIRIIDETSPRLDSDELANDPTVRGAFYEKLKPMLDSPEREVRERAESALRIGLQMLKKK